LSPGVVGARQPVCDSVHTNGCNHLRNLHLKEQEVAMSKWIVAVIAIAIGVSLSYVGVYQAKIAHNPAHVHMKRTG
jgi:hypothetical protein